MLAELYIEDQLVELTDGVSFPITKQFEDLQSPTDIINDWSKTISIPFTNANNRLFGCIFDPTRAVVTDGTDHDNAGVWFDPTKKMSARLVFNGDTIVVGYAKMTSIKRANGSGTYEINIFGELGNVMQNLKSVSFADLSADCQTFDINKEFVETCWTSEPDLSTDVETAAANNVIGFACTNQGLNSNFSSDTIQTGAETTEEMKDILTTAIGEGYNIDGLIGDGLTPRQVGDFRSYKQLPYIYVPRLFELVQRHCSEYTDGYSIKYHSDWFNDDNPYYKNLVMCLSRLSDGNETKDTTSYNFSMSSTKICSHDGGKVSGTIYSQTYTLPENGQCTFRFVVPIHLDARVDDGTGHGYVLNFDSHNALQLTAKVASSSNSRSSAVWFMDGGTVVPFTEDWATGVKLKDEALRQSTNGYDYVAELIVNTNAATMRGEDVTITLEYSWFSDSYGAFQKKYGAIVTDNLDLECNMRTSSTASLDITNCTGVWHSGYSVSLADLWGSEKTPWEVVVQYCKMFALLIKVDEPTKTITILPRSTFFAAATFEDWTDKVDHSKDYLIEPSSFDTKYIAFDCSDDTDKGEDYKNKIGVGFGAKRVVTSYEFNTDTNDIMSDVKAPIFSSENVLSWQRIKAKNFTYRNSEPMVYAQNDGEPADMFGTFYFYNGLYQFDGGLGTPVISDDTEWMLEQDTYGYVDNTSSSLQGSYTQVLTYPGLDIRHRFSNGLWDTKLSTFGIPAINYDSTKVFYQTEDNGIYDLFWDTYVKERYNINTKIITAYLWLTPSDFAQYDFNKIVKIGNRIFFVNKITDYDITKLAPTKCQLISIGDLAAYEYNPILQVLLYEVLGDTLTSHVAEDELADGTATLTYGSITNGILTLPKYQ